MPSASTLRDPSIPPAPPAQPNLTPEVAEGIRVAIFKLLWLSLYVAFMRLLGYRIRRDRAPRAAPAAPLSPRPANAAPPAPRCQHRYLDRTTALAMLADINAACAPLSSQPPAPAAATPRAPRARHSIRPAPAPSSPRAAVPIAQAARSHPPPGQNSARRPFHLRTSNSLRYQNEPRFTAPAPPSPPPAACTE
jgi:hypothetical protein